ncbi:MAG: hypothetical protein QOJ91_786 [Sphingomonadales bacterium]|jgi:hypothetical protein|nr:hypothetical protein [Sphingomonadales bacterium]
MFESYVIGGIALLFSILCFVLFYRNATREPVPAKVVDAAALRAGAPGFDPKTLGDLAKALADAFSKVGPGALALIGALLFLLLAGEALQVYHLTDGKGGAPQAGTDGKGQTAGAAESAGPGAGHGGGDAGNRARTQ